MYDLFRLPFWLKPLTVIEALFSFPTHHPHRYRACSMKIRRIVGQRRPP